MWKISFWAVVGLDKQAVVAYQNAFLRSEDLDNYVTGVESNFFIHLKL